MAGISIDMSTTDPEELAKVFAQLEDGETLNEKVPEKSDPNPQVTDDQTKNDPAIVEPQQAKQDQGQEPQGVATKDGKHVIPYTVLKSERDRASRAEQAAREAQERIAALEQQLQSGNQGAKEGERARTSQPAAESDLSDEDLEALKEDFPTVYKGLIALKAQAAALEAKLSPVQETVRNAEAEQARSAQETVQDAIDSVPKLAHVQASDHEAFELAKQFDATLRNQAAWANKPLSERFAKAIEMVEATLGPIELPGSPARASQPSAEDLKKAALAKAAQAAKASRSDVPTSLSEFPAGQHAAQDEREAAENLTALQLAEKFSSMSADQMDAYFRTL